MRRDHTHHEHPPRAETNGSSPQNGSSPHANGSIKSAETNGFHANGHGPEEAAPVAPSTEPFFGHDREEVTRILLQSLADLGYHSAARQLSRDSGYALEIPSVAAFRSAVLDGQWDDAEALLFGSGGEGGGGGGAGAGAGGDMEGGVSLGNGDDVASAWDKSGLSRASSNGFPRHGLPLAEGADTTVLRFLLRQQKYLERLEARDKTSALSVLRNELTPLKQDIGRLHALSELMMYPSVEELKRRADWDGAAGQSRGLLLSEISKSISPSVMIPEHRLATLFSSFQEERILNCRYHNTTEPPSLYSDHDCAADDFPLQMLVELKHHADEVWHLEFSHDGSLLATAGKDGLVCIYDAQSWFIRHEIREHERNLSSPDGPRGVCYIAFSPDDQYLISCSQNKEFVVVNVRDGRRVAHADHFDQPVTTAAWLPDSQTFVVGTQSSRRPLGLYSLRSPGPSSSSSVVRNNEVHSWRDPPWDNSIKDNARSFRVSDCAVNPDGTKMVATTTSNEIMMYDLRTKFKIGQWVMENKLNSVNFGVDGTQVLVSMSDHKVLALDAETGELLMQYDGARQAQYVIRSCFGGAGENFVISGSEDSRVYIWRRQTGMQVAVLDAHAGSVNAVAWDPSDPSVFASASDDRKVRIWTSASTMRLHPTEAGASRTSLSSYPFPR